MPQMAPLSWLLLFVTFSLMLIMFNTMNYYSFMQSPPKTEQQKKTTKSMNWKW